MWVLGPSPVSHAPNHLMLYLLLYRAFVLILPDVQSCSSRSTNSRRQREEREVVGVILVPAVAKTIITSCVGVGGARPAPARRPHGDVTVTSDTQHERTGALPSLVWVGWGGVRGPATAALRNAIVTRSSSPSGAISPRSSPPSGLWRNPPRLFSCSLSPPLVF